MDWRNAANTANRAMALTKMAVQVRRARSDDPAIRDAARRCLASLLADARGATMKVGQFLADFEGGDPFADLTRSVDPLPLADLLPAIKRAIDGPISTVFADIDPQGIAASLGQVHRAQLHSGEAVAIKVRYPHIAEAVDAELRLAGLMPGVGPMKKWGFDVDAYKRSLRDDLTRELDYRIEAATQTAMRDSLADESLIVPRVFDEYTRDDVLVQTWQQGERFEDACRWEPAARRHIAVTLLRTLFRSLFVVQEVHADPHAGNLLVRRGPRSPQVVLLDFGCTVRVAPQAATALLKLIAGARARDAVDPLACFAAMGFDTAKLASIADTLPALAAALTQPFAKDTPFDTRAWQLSKRIDHMLGESKWWFRSAAPSDLLFLLRAFNGALRQIEALRINLPWWPLLVDAVGNDCIERARASALPVPAVPRNVATFDQTATHLRVHVTRGSEQLVSVTMPASQVAVLDELIPDDTLARIQAAGIDIHAIIRDACAKGVQPGILFEADDQGRHLRVTLE